jgi:hypothetical protein
MAAGLAVKDAVGAWTAGGGGGGAGATFFLQAETMMIAAIANTTNPNFLWCFFTIDSPCAKRFAAQTSIRSATRAARYFQSERSFLNISIVRRELRKRCIRGSEIAA